MNRGIDGCYPTEQGAYFGDRIALMIVYTWLEVPVFFFYLTREHIYAPNGATITEVPLIACNPRTI